MSEKTESNAGSVKLIEIDTMTGNERDVPWLHDAKPTRERLEVEKQWREQNISGRYKYRIEDV